MSSHTSVGNKLLSMEIFCGKTGNTEGSVKDYKTEILLTVWKLEKWTELSQLIYKRLVFMQFYSSVSSVPPV
jgi:hypothetical protein